MSRFAAVPIGALDDERLEALHIRVLTALCSFGDKDGWCRVGQDKIAARARTNEARVSSCIGDLAEWGWVRKQRIGKMRVNVYQVLFDRDIDETIDLPGEQLADTASHVSCPPGKSGLPTQQVTLAPTANPIGTPSSNTVPNTPTPQPDARREAIDRIFAACGPGLVDLAKSHKPVRDLAARIDGWLAAWDLDADIIPVVEMQTKHRRQTPLYDFKYIEQDIATFHATRMQPVPVVEISHGRHERSSTTGGRPAYRGRGPSTDLIGEALAHLGGGPVDPDIIEHPGPVRARAAAGGV